MSGGASADEMTVREEADRQVEEDEMAATAVVESLIADDEEMPRVRFGRRELITSVLFVVSCVAFLYIALPKLAGFGTAVHHLEGGDSWWIAVGIVLEMCSFAGYIVLFKAVFGSVSERIGWPESYEVTMAGVVATRLFATAGAGGIALTVWALRRSGMGPRIVACRMFAFMVILYFVYAASLLIDGVGLASGVFPGGGSFALTVVPAIVALILFATAGAMSLLPGDIERRMSRSASGSGRMAPWIARGVAVPALAATGVRTAIGLVRERDPGLLGRSRGGGSTSPCCGRCSMHSARPRHSR